MAGIIARRFVDSDNGIIFSEMDKQIFEYAETIYAYKLYEVDKQQKEERSTVGLGQLRSLQASIIGRRMRERLKSFKEAFEHVQLQPSPEDFQEILQVTTEVYRRCVATTIAQNKRRAVATNGPLSGLDDVEAEAAHYHDEVLAEFKVWRSRVGLSGVRKGFAIDSIPSVNELKHREECVLDLQSLLDVEASAVTVLYIDLDNFKAVNDAKEHEGGDRCIAEAATIIGSVVQHKGRVYRLHGHGDEFAVILPNCDESEARATAERIRTVIERKKPGGEIPVTASIGGFVATGRVAAEDALNRADKAMFIAKKSKNIVHFE